MPRPPRRFLVCANRLYFSTKSGDPLYYRLIFSPDLILPALTERIGPCPHSALQDSLGAQLMFATPETRGPSNDSVLKTTTTWGRRIALLALITLPTESTSYPKTLTPSKAAMTAPRWT